MNKETIKGKATLSGFLKGMSPGARASLGLWDEFGSLEGTEKGGIFGVTQRYQIGRVLWRSYEREC